MRYGIIHHIAGNIAALTGMDAQFDAAEVNSKVCHGGVVGLYPFAEETVKFLVQKQYRVLKNDDDEAFVKGGPYVAWSRAHLADVFEYTRSRTSEGALDFLRGLPSEIVERGWRFTARFPGVFLQYEKDVKAAFATCSESIVFHGSHWDARIWSENGESQELQLGKHTIDRGERRLVSPGALGCRYGAPSKRASAMIFDEEAMSIEVLHSTWPTESVLSDLSATDYPRGALRFLTEYEFKA